MKVIFLVYSYCSSSYFRHYSLSTKDGESIVVSLRCHRSKRYWQILTKYPVIFIGITIPVWRWIIIDDYCLPKDMKKSCLEENLKLTIAKWYALQPHDYSLEKKSPLVTEEKLSAV